MSKSTPDQVARPLLGALVVAASAASLAPYLASTVGLQVNTSGTLEAVTHAVPGVLVLVLAALALVGNALAAASATAMVVAGMWMTGTHLPLLVDAGQGRVEWAAALWHSVPAIVVLGLAFLCLVRPERPPTTALKP